jgi:regulator of RNase E activity RraB
MDSVELEEIHAVVTMLTALAERHGGDYDGWETLVEAAGA